MDRMGYLDSSNRFWQKCYCQKCDRVFFQRPEILSEDPWYKCLDIIEGVQHLASCIANKPGIIAFG